MIEVIVENQVIENVGAVNQIGINQYLTKIELNRDTTKFIEIVERGPRGPAGEAGSGSGGSNNSYFPSGW